MKKQIDFDELKREYSLTKTTESRRTMLLKLMQENLKKRSGKERGTVMCLDGKECSLESDIVSELYAIDSALKESNNKLKRDEISKKARNKAISQNKYRPN